MHMRCQVIAVMGHGNFLNLTGRGVGKRGGGSGGGQILYISYMKCLGGDQCKKNLFKK